MKSAVCLLSGGLDSTTALYYAKQEGYRVHALTIHYGQLHDKEIESARQIAAELNIPHEIISISMPWKGSALLDSNIPVPTGRKESEMTKEIPSTYVPARNSIFLSFAASWAEVLGAKAIFFGANIQDYSGYPDCRPEYLQAFRELVRLGTKRGDEGKAIRIETPLLQLSKKEIVLLGQSLNVPFQKTWSCYQGKNTPCGECDSCVLRAKGFREAEIEDPLMRYAISSLR
ncbi:MAG: 7-cyano-7-deazaguanine synthase QueC [Candidatus Omnitrophica bacterium]|nr:7-cyano-7-deazaguanine synthase QueC [Candidatus Omnitrophota bacterium]